MVVNLRSEFNASVLPLRPMDISVLDMVLSAREIRELDSKKKYGASRSTNERLALQ